MSAARKQRPRIASIVPISESAAVTAASVRSEVALALHHLEEDTQVASSAASVIEQLRKALRALYAAEVGDEQRIARSLEVCSTALQHALGELNANFALSDVLQASIDRVETAIASLHSVRQSFRADKKPSR